MDSGSRGNLAQCLGATEIYFSETNPASVHVAKQTCARCPMSAECLEQSLSFDSSLEGVWAGLTRPERNRLRLRSGLDMGILSRKASGGILDTPPGDNGGSLVATLDGTGQGVSRRRRSRPNDPIVGARS